jgi:aquaporin Z
MDERSGRAEPGQLGEAEELVEAALGGLVRALEDFDDPSQEWRRLFAELFGTFLLVLAAAGGPMMGQVFPDMVGTAAAVVAPGLMVLVVILFMGKMSGAHLNPAAGYSAGDAFAMETVLTLGLVSVVLGTASGAQNLGPIAAFGVGAYIALAGLWAGPISGASMNPARSFGPDAVGADFGSYWVYVAGPLAGAVLAVGVAFILRGRGGGRSGSAAAQGALFTRPKRPDQR